MRLESFLASPDIFDRKFFVPDLAIVPRLSLKSFLLIPIPLSLMVRVGFSPSSNSMSIRGSKSIDLNSSWVNVRYLSLSRASDELEINSLKKISF